MRADADAAPGAGPDRTTFTPREWRVLRLLPTHLTIPGIAMQLGVAKATARTHVTHIYRKLGAGTRAEAVERAWALHLLPRSPWCAADGVREPTGPDEPAATSADERPAPR